jgi:hypothetical protein
MDMSLIIVATVTGALGLVIGIVLLILGFVILERLKKIESTGDEISSYLDSDPQDGEFRSVDGKYSANTLEELVQKMALGGELDLDPNDPDLLKKFFEELSNEDDGDEEEKPWEKES